MKIIDIMEYEDYEGMDNAVPDGSVPYKTKNAAGVLPLSPYTNDWSGPAGFKDVDYLVTKINNQIAAGQTNLAAMPANKILATQYWIDDDPGYGDAVFDELDDYPVAALLSDGYYHLIDGHHRTTAGIKSGRSKIKAYIFEL
jgi:hypothetical protein